MTRAIDTSLTVVPASVDEPIDVHTFADPSRYISIRSRAFGEALDAAVRGETRRRRVVVGGGGRGVEVEFFVLDLRHDKALRRQVAGLLNDAFIEATTGALKVAVRDGGLLEPDAADNLAAVENVIELQRFIANATTARPKRKTDLLFHFSVPEAAE